MIQTSITIHEPVTHKVLEHVRSAIRTSGAHRPILIIRTWPETHESFQNLDGFRAVEDYDVEELDDMQKGEIGRVDGFHIVVRWNGAPIRTKDGLYISEVVGGSQPFQINSRASV